MGSGLDIKLPILFTVTYMICMLLFHSWLFKIQTNFINNLHWLGPCLIHGLWSLSHSRTNLTHYNKFQGDKKAISQHRKNLNISDKQIGSYLFPHDSTKHAQPAMHTERTSKREKKSYNILHKK